MGGKLFNLGRMPREQYVQLEAKLRTYLDSKFGNNYRIPRYYSDKPDFGDADIILSTEVITSNWEALKKEIIADLNISRHKSTGAVFSTVYENFQVDYFIADHKYFISNYNFCCFNDLGNFIGKIARRFNLKYGERGLEYVFRRKDDDHYKKDIPLTTDIRKICEFFQLDYAHWVKGFANLEEMFEWVVACPYFSVAPYFDLSTDSVKRINHRTTFEKFVAWLEEKNIQKVYEYHKDKEKYLDMINNFFPEAKLLEAIEAEKVREARVAVIKGKFNGHLLISLTGVEGKELGRLIEAYKTSKTDFEKYIIEASQDEVNKDIVRFYGESFRLS